MIRQAISCDVCGAEKRQTNHWFVAYTRGGELRVMGWNASSRMRAGSKHLCGQTCLHKLLDEFIAGAMATRATLTPEAGPREEALAATDASLTSNAAYAAPAPVVPPPGSAVRSLQVVPAALVAITPARPPAARAADEPPTPPFDDPPNYGSRRWRSEAWERERERCSALNAHRKTS